MRGTHCEHTRAHTNVLPPAEHGINLSAGSGMSTRAVAGGLLLSELDRAKHQPRVADKHERDQNEFHKLQGDSVRLQAYEGKQL